MLKLYDYFRSSAAFRTRLALNYKALDYEKIAIDLRSNQQSEPDYLKLNPFGLVPLLVDEDNNAITQSLAIINYLEDMYPTPTLLPSLPLEKAYVRSIALSIACDIHPINNLRILNYLRENMAQTEEQVGFWHRHWIDIGLTNLEQLISTSKFYTGEFVFKDQFTLADICLLPQLVNARRFDGEVDKYPTLLAIEAKCRTYDWVNKAYPPGI